MMKMTTMMSVGVGDFVIGVGVEFPTGDDLSLSLPWSLALLAEAPSLLFGCCCCCSCCCRFHCRRCTAVVIWLRLRRCVVICTRRCVLLACGCSDRVAPVYRWEHARAPDRIILVSPLRGIALAIFNCRSSSRTTLGDSGSLCWNSCASYVDT